MEHHLELLVYLVCLHGLDDSIPCRVPTFYAPTFTDYDPDDWKSVTVGMCVAVVFGGIHCVAWSFYFPTPQEKLAWRISAASVAGLPVLFFVFGKPLSVLFEGRYESVETIFECGVIPLPVLYIIARVVILVLPWITLRELNPLALVEIQWAAFSPHIG